MEGENVTREILNKEDGGAIAVIASTAKSFPGYNDAMAYGIFSAIWSDIDFKPSFPGHGISPNSSPYQTRRLADALEAGMIYMYDYYGRNRNYSTGHTGEDYYRYQRGIYNCFGDPALKLYSKSPSALSSSSCRVIRSEDSIHVFTNNIPCQVTFYNTSTGEITNYGDVTSCEFPADKPDKIIVTLQKDDAVVFVSHGADTSNLF